MAKLFSPINRAPPDASLEPIMDTLCKLQVVQKFADRFLHVTPLGGLNRLLYHLKKPSVKNHYLSTNFQINSHRRVRNKSTHRSTSIINRLWLQHRSPDCKLVLLSQVILHISGHTMVEATTSRTEVLLCATGKMDFSHMLLQVMLILNSLSQSSQGSAAGA